MKKNNSQQNKVINLNTDKKPYRKPILTKLGDVRGLTLGTGSVNLDEGSIVPDLE